MSAKSQPVMQQFLAAKAAYPDAVVFFRLGDFYEMFFDDAVEMAPLLELTLGLYFTATLFYALANGIYGTVPFLMLFQVGFLYTGL